LYSWEPRILLSSLFGVNKPLGFKFSCRQMLRLCFSQVDVKLFIAAGVKLFLAGRC
jgi:hypothetical protein